MTCRSFPPRGSSRTAAPDAPAPSSAVACGRGRSASRTARGRGCSARPPAGSQGLQLRAEPLELLPLRRHDVRGRLLDKSAVGQLALGVLDVLLKLCSERGALAVRRAGVDLVAEQDLDDA